MEIFQLTEHTENNEVQNKQKFIKFEYVEWLRRDKREDK